MVFGRHSDRLRFLRTCSSCDKVVGMKDSRMSKRSSITEWEWLQESRHNAEMELQDMLAELSTDELKEYNDNPCRRCNGKKRGKCKECEV